MIEGVTLNAKVMGNAQTPSPPLSFGVLFWSAAIHRRLARAGFSPPRIPESSGLKSSLGKRH